MFFKISVLKNFAIFIGNTCVGVCKCNFIKKKLQNRCFPVNVVIVGWFIFYQINCLLIDILYLKLSLIKFD